MIGFTNSLSGNSLFIHSHVSNIDYLFLIYVYDIILTFSFAHLCKSIIEILDGAGISFYKPVPTPLFVTTCKLSADLGVPYGNPTLYRCF